jgi:serine/threonine protein kinase/Tfp pilus assembly protein PilF
MDEDRTRKDAMTPELWQRLKPLYNSAIEMREPMRAQYIADKCGDDSGLRRELEALLKAADRPTDSDRKPFVYMNDVFSAASNSFSEKEIILGRFQIVRHLGTGGMGEVYEANDLELGRIALKTIRPQIASSPRVFERFRQEVVLARKVSGMQVCRIHELFLLPPTGRRSATVFLTMEYLDGTTLSEKLAKDGPLPLKEALKIALDICEGLRLIHQQGIVHRDLKPGNIMLCERNGSTGAVLMDFGLALIATLDVSDPEDETRPAPLINTLTRGFAGTPAYMAPEQFEGKPVTPAADIYAFGVILYQLLTGRHPYPANTPVGVAIRRLKRPSFPSSVRHEVPRHWDRIIERCLEYEPSERFESAEKVAEALKASPFNFENLRKDRPWVLRLAGALALAALAWAGLHWWQSRQYYHPNPEEQRWYNTGLTALREGSYVKATRELEKATQQNSRFVMAHARLAEAWSNLDFDGAAQREMLIATGGERHLAPLDRMYLDAIRATLTNNFNGALVLYRKILDRLPDSQKAAGYVDLGMANERDGNPGSALIDYAKASKLDRDNPSPQMHIAILESHQHNLQQANLAFERAQTIFATEMNPEGQAELDYERGYEANASGDSTTADRFLERSLNEAAQIQSVQLEIRALTQLSSSACASGRPADAVNFAQRAIRLARDNQLNAWAADGLARLANARLVQGSEHFQEAEEAVDEAKTLAVQSQEPRAEALADLVLASLRDQEGRPDDVTAPAQAALAYYKQNGYFEPAADATLLLLRVDEGRGQFQQTLLTANKFAALAKQSGDPDLLMQAEQHVGTAYESLERYPEALQHFQKVRELAGNELGRAFAAVQCAETLIKIGRFGDAETMLPPLGKFRSLTISIGGDRTDELLGQGKYGDALELTTRMVKGHPDMTAVDKQEIQLQRAVAEAHLHHAVHALADLREAAAAGTSTDSSGQRAIIALQAAEVGVLTGQAQQARDNAINAERYFASTGQLDSDLRANLLAASASKALHDTAAFDKFSAKAIDIRSALEHTWDPQSFRAYLSRPDLRMLMRVLPRDGPTNISETQE